MDRLALDYEIMPPGYCGMAGSFGFERAKFDISMKIAGRVMPPKVRAADRDCLIIADGFSCREQIEQSTRRSTKHLAEVVAAGIALAPADGCRRVVGAICREIAIDGKKRQAMVHVAINQAFAPFPLRPLPLRRACLLAPDTCDMLLR
jgi:hypothetical protein